MGEVGRLSGQMSKIMMAPCEVKSQVGMNAAVKRERCQLSSLLCPLSSTL